jgi:small subunit ribosomal protein S1
VCFTVTGFDKDKDGNELALLSRAKAQRRCMEEYIASLRKGDVIDARVTHLESFGAFADIGCGIVALMPIDAISVSRIEHPKERFYTGMDIRAIVRSRENGRISLSHKELLGTWEENAAQFCAGETVSGIIRSVEPYGVFVELTPNLAGLAESREGVRAGQQASVYIKSILPDKMKIKLIIIDTFDYQYKPVPPKYFCEKSHIDNFLYSPAQCSKRIESVFDD